MYFKMEMVRNGFESDIVLNSLRSLENNFDDDPDIIGVHFRVSKRRISTKELFLNCLEGTSCTEI